MILTFSHFKMLLHSTFAVVFISVVAVARSEVCQGAAALQTL